MLRPFVILPLMTIAAFAAEESLAWKQLPALPDPLGLAAPFAGVSGGALIVAGGANFPGRMPWEGGSKVWHDTVWMLDQPNGSWREIGKLPRPLGYGVCVTYHDSVVCVGGSNADRHYPDAFRLTWKGGKLIPNVLPPLPMALSGASGALIKDTLYIAGGSERPGEQSASNRAFALDLAAKSPAWRELSALPEKPRLLAIGGAHDDAFYVFGGVALEPGGTGKIGRVYLRDAWSFREKDGWRRLTDMPKPCVAAPSPAPFINGHFLLLAGDDGSRVGFQPPAEHPGFPKGILAYDPELDRWIANPGEVPAPRATVPCVEWNGHFVIPSGEQRPGVRSPEVWAITPRQ
jgi:N-acetylneuraminic acid mutarotase